MFRGNFRDFSENCRYNAQIFSLAPSALAQVLYILCGERAQKGHVRKGVVLADFDACTLLQVFWDNYDRLAPYILVKYFIFTLVLLTLPCISFNHLGSGLISTQERVFVTVCFGHCENTYRLRTHVSCACTMYDHKSIRTYNYIRTITTVGICKYVNVQ